MRKNLIPLVGFVLMAVSTLYLLWLIAKSANRLFQTDSAAAIVSIIIALGVMATFFWPMVGYKRLLDKAIAMPAGIWLPHVFISIGFRTLLHNPFMFTKCHEINILNTYPACLQKTYAILGASCFLHVVFLVAFTIAYFRLLRAQQRRIEKFSFEVNDANTETPSQQEL